jgi:TolA-binding protein
MAPREDKMEAGVQAANLNKYFAFKEEEKDIEKKIEYKKNPELFVRDSVDYEIAYRQYIDEAKKMGETQNSDPNVINQQKFDIAFLQQQYNQQQIAFFRNPKKGVIPTPVQLIALGRYKKPENVKLTADSLSTILAKSLYGLASLFYSELDRSDSAYFYFKKILNDYPDKPVKVQTMYALGTYYETHNDSVKADSIFKYIYDNFEKDPLRNAAAQKLGLVKKEENTVITKKVDDPAEKFYDQAEQIYYSKKYVEAIDSFQTVYKKFPQSPLAPKAIYYIGLIYEKDLKMYDSAATAYGMLIKEFAKSPLSGTVLAKVTEYNNEKEKMKKEEENKQKELEAKQKEKEIKSADINKTTANKQPQAETIKDKKIVRRALLKEQAQKQDSPKALSQDSLKAKADTTKIKQVEK